MSKRRKQASPWKGHVYVLVNPAMPGLVKVGYTSRTPAARLKEINSATGVPVPFVMAGSVWSRDAPGVEARVHLKLGRRRLNRNREFFRCTPAEALKAAEEAAKAVPGSRFALASAVPPAASAMAVCIAASGWLAAWHPAIAAGWAASCAWAAATGAPGPLADVLGAARGRGAGALAALLAAGAAGWAVALGWIDVAA